MKAVETRNDFVNGIGIGNPSVALGDANAPNADFIQGKCAMSTTNIWAAPHLKTNAQAFKDVALIYMPQFNLDEMPGYAYGYSWAVNKITEVSVDAWKFISFLARKQNDWLRDVGFVQGRKDWSTIAAVKDVPLLDTWTKEIQIGTWNETGPRWLQRQKAVQRLIDAVVDPRERIVGVGFGMTGAGLPGNNEAYNAIAYRLTGCDRITTVGDAVTNLLGATGSGPGVIVVAGGGVIAYGETSTGRSARSGGWGPSIGNEGNWIGKNAINAALRAVDGRDAATGLVTAIIEHFDRPELPAIKPKIVSGAISLAPIAALTKVVAQGAVSGDSKAAALLRQAGRFVAEPAIAVTRNLGLVEARLFYPTGGLVDERRFFRPTFARAVRRDLPKAKIAEPRFPPFIGGAILALLAAYQAAAAAVRV